MQRIGDALFAVPLKAVQVIPDGMILILMSSDRQRLADIITYKSFMAKYTHIFVCYNCHNTRVWEDT